MKLTNLIHREDKKRIFRMFLVVSLSAGSLAVYAQHQKVQLTGTNITLKETFKQIEKQTKLFVDYNAQDLNDIRILNNQPQGENVKEVMEQLLRETGCVATFQNGHIIITKQKYPLNKTKKMTGTVLDAGGPVVGANVIEKGTTNGVITDIDGNFSLDAAEGTILQITFIGYNTTEVKVGKEKTIRITLQENSQLLDEVVVVAYGTQKKVNLTAAVESVDSKILENRPVKTASQMLEGVVPNLNVTTSSGAPDASASLNVRGFTGMTMDGANLKTQSGSPLILVDGVAQSLDMVNPNDIESISVLKDAAASAIYGSRAPYGVILVTTKSGVKGKKVSINYSGTYQINQPTMMPHSASSVAFAKSLNGAFNNSLKEGYYSQESIQRMQDYIDGKLVDNNIIMPNGRWGEHTDANANTDYLGYAFKDVSQNTTHDVSLSGGTEKSSYYAGLGYSFREGIYDTDLDKYNRYSAILKLDTEITNWLSVNINSRYVRQETTRPNFRGADDATKSDTNFWTNLGYFPNIPVKNPDGSFHRLSAMPMLDGAGGRFVNIVDDYWLTGGIKINPIKDLTVKGNFSWNMQSGLMDVNTTQFSINEPNGEVLRSARSSTVDKIYKKTSRGNYYTMDLTADYHKILGKHDLSVLGGLQMEYKQNHNVIGSTTGLYSQMLPSLNVSWGDNLIAKDEINHWSSMGYFFRLSYNYDSRYLLDVNGRYDAASKYPASSRWAFFPSVSGGWNIAREAFWPIEEISILKVTGSFGRLGDQGSGNYLYIPTMESFGIGNMMLGGERPPYVTMPGIIPPDITWSKPQSIGFGAEVAALNNRLRGEYYWYQRTIFDQLGPSDKLPEVLGENPPQTNNAVSETRGWELSLSWRDKACMIAEKPLNYNVRFILSDYVGYVVSYPDNISGARGAWTPGQEFGKIYGYRSTGVATNKDALLNNVLPGNGWYYPGDLMYQDLNGDGRMDGGIGSAWYSMGDLAELGYSYPRMKYSINLGLDWNNFNFSLFLDGVGKEVRYVNNYSSFVHTADWSGRYMFDQHAELGYWSANNPGAFFPRAYQDGKNFGSTNDKYLIDLAHLRIKNMTVGYNVPANAVQKIGLSRLSFNFSVENLGMIYNKSWLDLDPQMIRQNGNGYPIQRTYSLGVKIGI